MRQWQRLVLSLIVLALATFGTSCAHVASLLGLVPDKPKVEVKDVTLAMNGFDKVQVVASLLVENVDERRDLDLQKLQYEILSNNEKIGTGEIADVIKLRPRESTIVKLPVSVSLSQLLKVGVSMLERPSLRKVQVKGEAEVGTWAGNYTHRFDLKRDL
jgi:LEA14-like dessication related protein